MLKCDQDKVGP